MKKHISRKSVTWLSITAALAAIGLTGCGSSTNADQCAYVVGDGTYDRKLDQILYPGQQVNPGANKEVWFVPCGPRNFIVTSNPDPNFGDQHDPLKAKTKSPGTALDGSPLPGTPVKVWATAYFQLNQSDAAMKAFLPLCRKSTCYTTDAAQAGNVNFSTSGWENGVLKENFGPAMERAANQATAQFGDEIWRQSTQDQKDQIAAAMSKNFAEQVRKPTGSDQNLFCGSGDSGWPDPDKPGVGEFRCTQVRFVVDTIEPLDPKLTEQANQATAARTQADANNARKTAADELYGPVWGSFWLGLQDTCQTKCTIVLGSGGIPLPTR